MAMVFLYQVSIPYPDKHLYVSSVTIADSIHSLPIGAIAIVVIAFVLTIHRENNPDHLTTLQRIMKFDLIGASILVPAVVCLTALFIYSQINKRN